MAKTALVAGATGLVGSHLINLLSKNPAYDRVKVLVRRPIEASDSKIEACLVNFDELQKEKEFFINVDEIFCCLGSTMKKAGSREAFYKVDFSYVYELAKLGKASGTHTFILNSSIGADPSSAVFYNRVKGEIEEKLKELGFERLIIVRPSLLLGKRREFRLGEEIGKIIGKLFSPFFIGSLKKYKPVQASAVANAMLRKAASTQKGLVIVESQDI